MPSPLQNTFEPEPKTNRTVSKPYSTALTTSSAVLSPCHTSHPARQNGYRPHSTPIRHCHNTSASHLPNQPNLPYCRHRPPGLFQPYEKRPHLSPRNNPAPQMSRQSAARSNTEPHSCLPHQHCSIPPFGMPQPSIHSFHSGANPPSGKWGVSHPSVHCPDQSSFHRTHHLRILHSVRY